MVWTVKPVYRVEIAQSYLTSALVLNTPHFEWSGGGGTAYPTATDLLALGNAWKETFRPSQMNAIKYENYKAVQVGGDGVTYSPTTCRQIGGTAIEVAPTGTVIGPTGVNPVPPAVSLVASFGTGLVGKSRHGRQYIAGLASTAITGGIWGTTILGTLNTAVSAFLAVYGAGGTSADWTMVIFSRVIASGCKADPNTRHHPLVHVQAGDMANAAKHVTSFVLDSVARSTRTRQIGKGS
jgi:hypothetical protein